MQKKSWQELDSLARKSLGLSSVTQRTVKKIMRVLTNLVECTSNISMQESSMKPSRGTHALILHPGKYGI